MPESDPAGPFDSDPFLEHAAVSVREADERHAVVEQRADPALTNHAGVRHAGALFTVGYAASRALIAAALDGSDIPTRLTMTDSEIEYTRMVTDQRVTAVAQPGTGWEASLGRAHSEESDLPTEVTLSDEEGNVVATLKVRWRVTPVERDGAQ